MEKSSKPRKSRYHHGDLERALVATALEIIATDGLEALTLRRVGADAGVSRAALYRHFDSKGGLLARIAADGFRLLSGTLKRVRESAPPDDARETLDVMAAAHIHFAHANPSHYATMFGGSINDWRSYPEVSRAADAALDEVLGAVRDAQQGGAPAGDPRSIALVLWALTFGIARLGSSGRLTHPARSLEELAVLGSRWVSDGCQMGV